MGKVVTLLKLKNLVDEQNAQRGLIPLAEVRSLELEALVDRGATTLVLPEDAVTALGLSELRRSDVRLADGSTRRVPWVTGLLIEILGRNMSCHALVMPAGSTPLIGQIPLEALDLVVDPKSREVTVNPASPDIPLLDALRA
jgi:clan AA aspartic protease